MNAPPAPGLHDHSGLAARRATVGLTAGAAASLAALGGGALPSVAILAGWDTAAAVFLVWVWSTVAGKDAAATALSAQAEDASRAASEAALIGACIASLVTVAFTLVEAGDTTGAGRALLIVLAVGSVVLAWASVHTVYALRYARLYYSEPVGGIDFNESDPPRYLDFAYVALTVGMTSQVSDTALTARRLRRAAIHHALLSYVFGTTIVALTINIVASLLGR
ncbi:MAG: DUF1345 domain-containing protein [Gaiellaceae bacterium]